MSGYSHARGLRWLYTALLLLLSAASVANAQYWFQSGAQGDFSSEYNSGASVSIQTISPQNESFGSLGYWVGETLSNGAFIQVGYQIPNVTGQYPTGCSPSGCTGRITLLKNEPSWFWEYFPANSSGSQFYGDIGPDGSVGANGTFNTYSFKSSGNVWTSYVNGKQVGSVDLGASNSGNHAVLGIAEYADTDTNSSFMPKVEFRSLSYFDGASFVPLPEASDIIGYGVGSSKAQANPYGVQEVDHLVNDYVVGTALPQVYGEQLWHIGYSLKVSSQYGGINSTVNYTAGAQIALHAPTSISTMPTQRVSFSGWVGSGQGSYTGPDANASVRMDGDIVETAKWNTQYYLNISSPYGTASGGGWYSPGATASISIDVNTINLGLGKRVRFDGWSNGQKNMSFKAAVFFPQGISAEWKYQYLVNSSSPYGSVTGNGWYDANSTVDVSLANTTVPLTVDSRFEFVDWTNGMQGSTITVPANGPLLISAVFDKEYLVTILPEDIYGNPISVAFIKVNGATTRNLSIFQDPSKTYVVEYANYKGVNVSANYTLPSPSSPGAAPVKLHVYNIAFSAYSLLSQPVNATLNLTFSNGTRELLYTGEEGRLELDGVPYGYSSGYEIFDGQSHAIDTAGTASVSKVFVTPADAAVVVVVLAAVFVAARRVIPPPPPPPPQPKSQQGK